MKKQIIQIPKLVGEPSTMTIDMLLKTNKDKKSLMITWNKSIAKESQKHIKDPRGDLEVKTIRQVALNYFPEHELKTPENYVSLMTKFFKLSPILQYNLILLDSLVFEDLEDDESLTTYIRNQNAVLYAL